MPNFTIVINYKLINKKTIINSLDFNTTKIHARYYNQGFRSFLFLFAKHNYRKHPSKYLILINCSLKKFSVSR